MHVLENIWMTLKHNRAPLGYTKLCALFQNISSNRSYKTKTLNSGPVFYLHSSLLKLSKLWDTNFSFNYLKQIHFLSQKFENLLKQGT